MTDKLETDDTEQIRKVLKTQNRLWIKNKWLFWTCIILSPAAFVWGFFIPLDSTWQHWVQSIIFIVSVGFFIVPMSYLFNLLWMVFLGKKSANRDVEESSVDKN